MNRYFLFIISLLLVNACNRQEKTAGKNGWENVFEQVWQHVNDHYYDPDFNGVDWESMYQIYKVKIKNTDHVDSLYFLLDQMLFELNSSHCGVGPLSAIDEVVSPYLFAKGSIGIDVRIIGNQVVVTKVMENSSAKGANIHPGYVIESIDGVNIEDIQKQTLPRPPFNNTNKRFHLTSEILRRLYGEVGTNVEIRFKDEKGHVSDIVLQRNERKNGIEMGAGLPTAYLHSKSKFLTEEMAYLSFNSFSMHNVNEVLTNLNKVFDASGLIIDLRGNDGGSIEAMKMILGHFVDKRTKYGTYVNRCEKNEDFIEPAKNMYQGKIVILIDEMSISGAENMAGIIQHLSIGTVIGTRTPGQMLWGNAYVLNDSIALALPIYKMEYPNGYNPENNGINPDIISELTKNDLASGKDTQLQKAMEWLTSQQMIGK